MEPLLADMESLLAKTTPGDILEDPFPHVVVDEAMAPDLYRRFAADVPGFERVGWAGPPPNNARYVYYAERVLVDRRLDPSWTDFVETHASVAFFRQVMDLFADHWERLNPGLVEFLAAGAPRFGLLQRDSFETADVLLDARLEINTPVSRPSGPVRGGHVDTPNRLYSGLFYLRTPDDETEGGDLELLRWKDGIPGPVDRFKIPEDELVPVKTVSYAANRLVLFPNSPHALHGVSPRAVTPHQRSYMFVTAEVEEDLFGEGRIRAGT